MLSPSSNRLSRFENWESNWLSVNSRLALKSFNFIVLDGTSTIFGFIYQKFEFDAFGLSFSDFPRSGFRARKSHRAWRQRGVVVWVRACDFTVKYR